MSDEAGSAAPLAVPTRLERLKALIEEAFPGKLVHAATHAGELTYETRPSDLLEAAATLRDRSGLEFQMCMDVCGVDYLQHGRSEWKTEHATVSGFSRGVARGMSSGGDEKPGRRFAVVYHLLSISQNLSRRQQLVRRHFVGQFTRVVGHPCQPRQRPRDGLRQSFEAGRCCNRRRAGRIGAHRIMALLRRILFCNWMIPYRSASAVGGQPGT